MNQLIELLWHIKSDPTNAGYWLLLAAYSDTEIRKALDEMGL